MRGGNRRSYGHAGDPDALTGAGILDVWAIIHIVQSGTSTGKKVLWVLLMLLLPLVGFLIWLLLGPRKVTSAV